MKKGFIVLYILWVLMLFGMVNTAVTAQDDLMFIPIAGYDYLSLDSLNIHSPGIGLVVMNKDVTAVGLYKRHSFGEGLLYDYPDVYHSIELVFDGKKDRHNYLAVFKSESDEPVYGGLHTYQAALAYGYRVVDSSRFSLVLGGGLAVSDFGLELPNGNPWPVIPVPLLRMNYNSKIIDASLEFITSPNVRIVLAPENQFRLTGDFRVDQLRDLRDLIFECALVYRFFPADHPMGDLAGISLGVKSDNYGFDLGDKDESLEIHYYALFGQLDLTLLKLTGGYAFEGREMYREEHKQDTGDGFYLSIQGMYQF